ncbi:P-loop NTPase fold protein [Demequina sp. SYSU T00068]|uniref:KAP family P-loop NTPase fold protein n=1 Tax=Demequina lignilytica TaxID=3051663 RepID=UPI002639A57F|nr:P-loop NTPase fold protein [Demequina sp. SYSU T00068]MDN4489676.1 P-loop NTPase fold protein [Demequina sp. SYSU T00068]
MSDAKKPPVDNPIKSSKDDRLGRAELAHAFARDLRGLDLSEGAVVGVLGPWGSGKSSFVNLMKEDFAAEPRLAVVDFNPWMFSGAQQLVDVFFKEIASELRVNSTSKFGDIAEALDEYGDVLSPIAILPIVGGWWDRAHKSYKTARKWWKERGAQPIRTKVAEALEELDDPVVIVIDDIDRLSTDEIRDIFRLVRLTASFPNVIYVLAFDRLRVEAALDDTNVPGRAYLEKIVQLNFDLPIVPRDVLRSQIFEALNRVLEDVEDLRFNRDAWSDVFFEVVEPLISNMRDVTRLELSARSTLRALGGDVEGVDLVVLEAIRVFRPEIFERLQAMRTTLTETNDSFGMGRRDDSRQKAEVESLVHDAGDDAELVRSLIKQTFPAARQYIENNRFGYDWQAVWRRNHRVAHIDFLAMYFERVAPSGIVAFRKSERAATLLTDQYGLARFLNGLAPEDLEDTVEGLEVYSADFSPEMVVPASVALLNAIALFPVRAPRGFTDINKPEIVVGRVVLRLFQRIEDEAEREAAVSSIFPELRSYSTQLELIQFVGHREHVGHKLVSEEFAERLEAEFFGRVSAARSSVPSEEWDLLRVYWSLKQYGDDSDEVLTFTNVDEIRSLFLSARSVAQSQSFGSRNLRQEEHLSWDALLEVLGDEDALRSARDTLQSVDGGSSLVLLVDKYLEGWRPER